MFISDLDSLGWNVGNAINSSTRWCIGVFVMVSGALLLGPHASESAGRFYAQRMRRLLVPTLAWSVLYFALAAASDASMSWQRVADDLWHGRPGYHMWYLFMALGLYAVTPLLRVLVAALSRPARWAAIALLFAAASVYDLGCAFWDWPRPDVVPLMFLPYLGYYLCGYELREAAPAARTRALAGVVAAACVVITALGTRALIGAHGITFAGLFFYEYVSPNVIAMSIAVFLLAAGRGDAGASPEDSPLARFVVRMAPLTLGIYLAHPMVISGLHRIGVQTADDPLLGVFAVALPAFALSAAISFALSRVPGLRQSVGFA